MRPSQSFPDTLVITSRRGSLCGSVPLRIAEQDSPEPVRHRGEAAERPIAGRQAGHLKLARQAWRSGQQAAKRRAAGPPPMGSRPPAAEAQDPMPKRAAVPAAIENPEDAIDRMDSYLRATSFNLSRMGVGTSSSRP